MPNKRSNVKVNDFESFFDIVTIKNSRKEGVVTAVVDQSKTAHTKNTVTIKRYLISDSLQFAYLQ